MLRTRLVDGMKEAMKSGEKRKLSTLRLINAAIKDRDISARGAGKERVSDEEILAILSKMIKQREDSARIYEEGNRIKLAAQEREDFLVTRRALPSARRTTAVAKEDGALSEGWLQFVDAASLKNSAQRWREVIRQLILYALLFTR